MTAMNASLLPDRRLANRLDGLVRKTSSPRAFAAAGRVVIGALGHGGGPRWARELCDAMSDSLWLVQARTVIEEDAAFRVELATAAMALASVRPERRVACLEAVRVWLGLGMIDATEMTDPVLLAQRALLALIIDDTWQAERCVAQLGLIELSGAGAVLHDWVVARRQRHGMLREAQCFHHLRLALSDASPGVRATVMLLATVAIDERSAALQQWAPEPSGPDEVETTDPVIRLAV